MNMANQEHRVSVDGGKYTFVIAEGDYRVAILRHGEPWHPPQAEACNALGAIMCELDAARVVVEAARKLADHMEKMPLAELGPLTKGDAFVGITRAIALHDSLTGYRTPPSPWAKPVCGCTGGDVVRHDEACSRWSKP
jgi:hypothetical protein